MNRIYVCKWGDCKASFPIYSLFEEHVLEHVLEAQPVIRFAPCRDAAVEEKAKVTISGKSLSFVGAPDDIDLMSTDGEDDESEAQNENSPEEYEDGESDDIKCSLCDSGREQKSNQIVICDGCEGGFHQKCHPTAILDSWLQDPDSTWYCYNCQPASTSTAKRICQ